MDPLLLFIILVVVAFSVPHIYEYFKYNTLEQAIELNDEFLELTDRLIAQNDKCIEKLDEIEQADKDNIHKYWSEYVEEARKYSKIYNKRLKIDKKLSRSMSDMDMFYEPLRKSEPVSVRNFDKLKSSVENMFDVELEKEL